MESNILLGEPSSTPRHNGEGDAGYKATFRDHTVRSYTSISAVPSPPYLPRVVRQTISYHMQLVVESVSTARAEALRFGAGIQILAWSFEGVPSQRSIMEGKLPKCTEAYAVACYVQSISTAATVIRGMAFRLTPSPELEHRASEIIELPLLQLLLEVPRMARASTKRVSKGHGGQQKLRR